MAIKKNRSVKGSRALYWGAKPHSKGLIFSRANTNFFLSPDPAATTTSTKANTKEAHTTYIMIN